MKVRFRAICQSVRRNNGLITALFSRYPTSPIENQKDALFSVPVQKGEEPIVGMEYWVSYEPAGPH